MSENIDTKDLLYDELLDYLANKWFDEYNWDYESTPIRDWQTLVSIAEDLGKYHIIRDVHNEAIQILMNQ